MPSPPSPFADRLAQALSDRYTVEREIGAGGMAHVYLAQDRKHHRQVAIKVLRPELSASLGTERFLREIAISAQLQHPLIVPLYDSGEADGLLYYVMPYVEGESLRDRLRREKQLPLDQAIAICTDVAEALTVAHSHGVVHRDVKPENILLSGEHAMVADFGVARALSAAGGAALTDSGVAIGTPAYMSPEQASGVDDVDARTDIYALGCVLQEMLTGEPPFTGVSAQAIIARHASQEPPSVRVVRPTVPDSVERAIGRALAKVPADRYTTAAAFAEALHRHAPPVTRRAKLVTRVLFPTVAVGAVVASGLLLRSALSDGGSPIAAPPATPTSGIAVLYFKDRSADGSLRWVADGLTEDLIDQLTHVEALRVASALQVRQYADAAIGLDSLAALLGADLLVDGAVSGTPESLGVAVRLIEGRSARLVASQSFTAPRSQLLQVRDSLVREVADALRRELGGHVQLERYRAETSNPEAWLLVQHAEELNEYGHRLRRSGGDEVAQRALGEADSLAAAAERLDPNWIVPIVRRGWFAWTNAALVYDRFSFGEGSPGFVDWLRVGLGHAERALAKRPADARGLELRGYLRYRLWTSGSIEQADTLLDSAENDLWAAVRWDPSLARAWYGLSLVLGARGRHTEAAEAARMALEKDAYLADAEQVIPQLFFTSLERGNFAEANRWCEEGRRRFPEEPNLIECRISVLGWSASGPEPIAEAWLELERTEAVAEVEAGRPYRRLLVAAILARSGLGDSARAVLRRTRDEYPGETMYIQEAYVRLELGEIDEALHLLELTLDEYPHYADWIANHYWFRQLRDDDRFQQIVSRAESAVDTP
ncbi:MAG: tetratricopeptide repeat-containing serine/threonine-protein kinase [Gemmatimonadota bacterium]|nr:tetratricopeptide repeat-containing serine/threonine-protein kinase [Gemmatimonadota bacterium]